MADKQIQSLARTIKAQWPQDPRSGDFQVKMNTDHEIELFGEHVTFERVEWRGGVYYIGNGKKADVRILVTPNHGRGFLVEIETRQWSQEYAAHVK